MSKTVRWMVIQINGQKMSKTMEQDKWSYEKIDQDAIVITGYTGSEKELVVPKTIDGVQVCGINNMAFF